MDGLAMNGFAVEGGRLYGVAQHEVYSIHRPLPDGAYTTWPSDYTEHTVFEDIIVPDGKWVLECAYLIGGGACYVGIEFSEIEEIALDTRYGMRRRLAVADRPFGHITTWSVDYTQSPPALAGGHMLSVARQIHKGELGRTVEIPRLTFAREPKDSAPKMHAFPRGRDQRRSPFRWARLTDLEDVTGHTRREILLGFWPFVDFNYDPEVCVNEPSIELRFGTRESIEDGTAGIYQHIQRVALDILDPDMIGSGAGIWVRAGFANTVLRLLALGYQPAPAAQPV